MSFPLQEIFLVTHSGKILAGFSQYDPDPLGPVRQDRWSTNQAILYLDDLHDGYHRIRIYGDQTPPHVLDVQGGSKEPGALLQWYPWHGGDNQRFSLEPIGDGHYFHLVAKHSGLALDVPGSALEGGQPIQQFPRNNGDNQRWRLSGHPAPITVRHSGLVLDVQGGSKQPGALVQQFKFHGGDNQLFTLEPQHSTESLFPLVKIVCKHSGLVLEIQGGAEDAGAKLQQNHRSSGDNQIFCPYETEEGRYFGLYPIHSAPPGSSQQGMALGVESASQAPGAPIIQWWSISRILTTDKPGVGTIVNGAINGNNEFNQQWRL
jgi:hypothetical protein